MGFRPGQKPRARHRRPCISGYSIMRGFEAARCRCTAGFQAAFHQYLQETFRHSQSARLERLPGDTFNATGSWIGARSKSWRAHRPASLIAAGFSEIVPLVVTNVQKSRRGRTFLIAPRSMSRSGIKCVARQPLEVAPIDYGEMFLEILVKPRLGSRRCSGICRPRIRA